jgi:GTPase SAR1 family protein
VLVYDVTDSLTFQNLGSWMKDVDNYCGEEAVRVLIGNKSDAEEMRAVSTEQAQEFANEHNLLFMEASAKRATNVKAAFRLLVAEVMHKADTLANAPPAFQEKVRGARALSARATARARE